MAAMLGYGVDEMVGRPVPEFLFEEDIKELHTALQAQRQDGHRGKYECRLKHRNGTARWVLVSATPKRDENGNVIGSFAMFTDITERKRAEEALRESEERERRRAAELQAVMEAVPATVFITLDPECRFIFGSRWTYDLFRLPPGSNLSKSAPDDERPAHYYVLKDGTEVPPEELPVQKAAATGQPLHQSEFDLVFDDGTIRYLLGNAVPLLDENGNSYGAVGVFNDITEQKRAKEALEAANTYNRSLIEANLDPLVTIGLDGRITDVNTATEQVTGYTRNELIGTDFSDYFTNPGEARAGYQKVFAEGRVRDYPLEIWHRDGHTTPVLYNATVYRSEDGKVTGVFAAARDITERKNYETQSAGVNR